MGIFKKVLSLFIIVLLLGSQTSFAKSVNNSPINSLRNELIKTKNGLKTINSVDSFIEKNKDNKLLLEKLKERISNLPYSENRFVKDILNYMSMKIDIELENTSNKNVENTLNGIEKSSISTEEKQKSEIEIKKIQKVLYNSIEKSIYGLFYNSENGLNLEEKGNFKMNFNIDEESLGKFKSSLNLNNYTYSKSDFDSQIKGEIEGLLSSNGGSIEEMSVKVKGFIDFIKKDDNFYLLLEKFNITDEKNTESIKSILDMIKNLSKENKYLKTSTNTNSYYTELNSINTFINSYNGNALLSAYKKDGNKYILIPTKYACNLNKELFTGYSSACTESQYNDMLKVFLKQGEVYLEVGDKTKLGFNLNIKNGEDIKVSGEITVNNENLEEIYFSVIPSQTKYPNESLVLNYKKNDSLNLRLYADKGDINIDLKSKISGDKFTFIDYTGKFSKEFNSKLKFEKNKINGSFELALGYNGKEKISGTITGETKQDNSLKMLKIDYSGYLNSNKIDGNSNYNNPNLEANLSVKDKNLKDVFSIKTTGKYEEKYLELNNIINFDSSYLIGINKKTISNINLKYNKTNKKNDFNLYMDLKLSNKKVFDLEIDNKSNVEYKKQEIKTPTNVINEAEFNKK